MLSVYNLSGVLLALVLIFSVLPAKPEPVFAQGTIQHLEFSLPHSRQAFQSMVDLSVKPNGELFAATNDQILRFDSNDVVTNYFGSYGVENDNFIGILALELDDDSFFVANYGNQFSDLIRKFDSNGTQIAQINRSKIPTNIEDFAIDENNLYLGFTTFGSGGIEVYDKNLNYLTPFPKAGSNGTLDGNTPRGHNLAVDDSRVYVFDDFSSSVKFFDKEGNLLKQIFGTGQPEGEFASTGDVAVDDSLLYVLDSNHYRVKIFAKEGPFISEFDVRTEPSEQIQVPLKIAVRESKIYVTLGTTQLRVFDLDGNLLKQVGTYDRAEGSFMVPWKISVDDSGIYVLDLGDVGSGTGDPYRVNIFDVDGNFISRFSLQSQASGQFGQPTDIAVDNDRIYVSDSQNQRLAIYDKSGTFLTNIPPLGETDYSLRVVRAITLDAEHIYVGDSNSNGLGSRILILDKSGHLLRTIDYSSITATNIGGIRGLAIDSAYLYVLDTYGVKLFNNEGTLVNHFDFIDVVGTANLEAAGIDVDEFGIYITEWHATNGDQNIRNRVIIIDKLGNFVDEFGSTGASPDQFHQPQDVEVANSKIYVVDTNNYRIQVFKQETPEFLDMLLRSFLDLNGNQAQDTDEEALPGSSFTIRDDLSNIVCEGDTSSDNPNTSENETGLLICSIADTGLNPGPYQITQTVGQSYVSTGPNPKTIEPKFEIVNVPIGNDLKLRVSSISPNSGGNTGYVTTTLEGNGFTNQTIVQLQKSGEPDIVGTIAAAVDGRKLVSIFNLTNASPGFRDLGIENIDGTRIIVPDAFFVEEGGKAKVWVDLVGPSTMLRGRTYTFILMYGNMGNIDAHGAPIFLSGLPNSATVEFVRPLASPKPPKNLDPYPIANIPPFVNEADGSIVPSLDPNGNQIPPTSFEGSKTLGVVSPVIPPGVTIGEIIRIELPEIRDPRFVDLANWYATPGTAEPFGVLPFLDCVGEMAKQGFGFVPIVGTIYGVADEILGDSAQSALSNGNTLMPMTSAVVGKLDHMLSAAEDAATITDRSVPDAASKAGKLVGGASAALALYPACKPFFDKVNDLSKPVEVVTLRSIDPNDKIGSVGYGPLRFISGDEPLRYMIRFENLANATAPAQTVTITDQLDQSLIDLGTLRFGPIGFGDTLVMPESQSGNFTSLIDLMPTRNVTLAVEASLDNNGRLLWNFTSIDPSTGNLPGDVLTGFLPPNVLPPEGEGFVTFSVMPKSSVSTDTLVSNDASIIFDVNDTIETPEWFNTIDRSIPQSTISPMAATQNSTIITLEVTGNDTGSGIVAYDIYVSKDGGDFSLALEDTLSPANFTGASGHTYSFYSIARDGVGNLEMAPSVPDAHTAVEVPNHAPVALSITAGTVQGESVEIELQASDEDGDAITFTIVDQPSHGSVSGSGANLTYSPNASYVGTDLFTFSASDGEAESNTGTVTVQIAPLASTTASLQVNSFDLQGNSITGYWTVLRKGGAIVETGFTPKTFVLDKNIAHTVSLGNYGTYYFDHWQDTNSTISSRTVNINTNSFLTAVYRTTPLPQNPQGTSTLTVRSVDLSGNTITGYWITLARAGQPTQTGFTPKSFLLDDNAQYTLGAGNYGTYYFDHWADTSSTTASRTANINSDTTLTAVYRTTPLPPNPADTSTLTIRSVDASGNTITGYWTVLRKDGTVVQTGFTPNGFALDNNVQYVVSVGNYGAIVFDHWQDTIATTAARSVNISSDTTLTAVYRTTA